MNRRARSQLPSLIERQVFNLGGNYLLITALLSGKWSQDSVLIESVHVLGSTFTFEALLDYFFLSW